jgi:serine protease Do
MRNKLLLATLATGLALSAGPSAQAQKGPDTVAPLAARLIDAVVNISTSQVLKSGTGDPLPKVPKGSPFEELFEDFFSKRQGGFRDRKVSSLGSGFVIDGKEGLIVTNNHVIEGSDEIIINFHDGSRLKVDRVLGRDKLTDLALLKVTPKKPLAAVKFGNSQQAAVGDWVIAIGNPFGLGGSVSVGIVSAKQRDIQSGKFDEFIQTDAAINKGNSGGPLFNMQGDVIGVNTAIYSPGASGGSVGIGFAVPADTAKLITDQLLKYGETRRGFIGVKLRSITDDQFEETPLEAPKGAIVDSVTPGSPADKAGLRPGDVVTKFDGRDIATMRALTRIIAQTDVGRDVDVEVTRRGQVQKVKVNIGRAIEEPDPPKQVPARRPPNAQPGQPGPDGKKAEPMPFPIGTQPLVGIKLGPLDDDTRKKFKIGEKTKGVAVIEVEDKSVAAQREIKPGDVIVEVAQKPVTSVEEVFLQVEEVKNAGRALVLLRVESPGGNTRLIAYPYRGTTAPPSVPQAPRAPNPLPTPPGAPQAK